MVAFEGEEPVGEGMILSAEKMVVGGVCRQGIGIVIDSNGRIASIGPLDEINPDGNPIKHLEGKVLLPAMVNAHSHAFQRLLRGRTHRAGPAGDNFWTWRKVMYHVANTLTPESIRAASRQAFLEMMLSGITAVGEFHYVHHQPGGVSYADPSVLALAVIEAARDVGIRIVLLRTVYLRGDFDQEPGEHQKRFCDPSISEAMQRIEDLRGAIEGMADLRVSMGVACHSVRAMAKEDIVSLKTTHGDLPFHLHVSEQRSEVQSCIDAYGLGPIAMLAEAGVLDGMVTLVHGTHLEPGEDELIARFGSTVCVCPSTEADLGDGLIDASALYQRGVPLSLGTDDHTLSSILEEARRLEMHERLRKEARNTLTSTEGESSVDPAFRAATLGGARSLNLSMGDLGVGLWADCVSYDLNDPSLAGCDDESLLGALMFSADNRALRDVMVGGKWVVKDGIHPMAERTHQEYSRICESLFSL